MITELWVVQYNLLLSLSLSGNIHHDIEIGIYELNSDYSNEFSSVFPIVSKVELTFFHIFICYTQGSNRYICSTRPHVAVEGAFSMWGKELESRVIKYGTCLETATLPAR